MRNVRVRFAPSPTGGLHLGGVRTALFNYLFAKKNGGTFILRIEDTDQTRFVRGAEQYIYECLDWAGISPDEGPNKPGAFGPYRQSERKERYRQYAEKLVSRGHAYYAFDTPDEIEALRAKLRASGSVNLQYGHHSRMQMRNSLTLPGEEVNRLIKSGTPYVIRIKLDPNEAVRFHDLIRGDIEMNTDTVDDKVLLKADGMPTYHLAVVVDDHAMEITHTLRGEEWLPSAPVHILLYKYLGWDKEMPEWAHLPLILKPDGNGKLSKRDGERLGFPVFAMEWNDPKMGLVQGFREFGFLPEAFINMLALLGWNDGSGQEIFSLQELTERFDIERVHAHGAKFDFEKAKWFNHEWIKKMPNEALVQYVAPILKSNGITEPDSSKLENVISLVKERCTLLNDFVEQSGFFFTTPQVDPQLIVENKWDATKKAFVEELARVWDGLDNWDAASLEKSLQELAVAKSIKPGKILFPLRLMLVGGKFGPHIYDIAAVIGKEETIGRITRVLAEL